MNKKKAYKAVKLLAGVFMLPALLFAFWQVIHMAFDVALNFRITLFFLAGGALYCAVHAKIFNFSRAYVFAHESAHALMGALFGFKIYSMKVNKNSGAIQMDEINAPVALAPYILPLYFIVAAALFYLLYANGFDGAEYKNLFAFVLGALWAFHIIHTVKTLTETSQPDLKAAGGKLFSLSVIVFFNLLFVIIFLGLMFPESLSAWQSVKEIFLNTLIFWEKLLKYVVNIITELLKS